MSRAAVSLAGLAVLVATAAAAGCGSSSSSPATSAALVTTKTPKLVFSGAHAASVPGRATCDTNPGRMLMTIPVKTGELHSMSVAVPTAGVYPSTQGTWVGEINNGSGPPWYELHVAAGHGKGTLKVAADASGSIHATFVGIRGTPGSVEVSGAWSCT
jgi:hypothetical protein